MIRGDVMSIDTAVNSIALVIRATNRIESTTGGRDNILQSSTSGGAAMPHSAGPTIPSPLESNKGGSVNTSA